MTYRILGSDEAASGEAEELRLLGEIHLGIMRSAGGGFVAQAVGSPIVYLLDAAFAEDVPVSLNAFRERFVIEPEPPTASDSAAE